MHPIWLGIIMILAGFGVISLILLVSRFSAHRQIAMPEPLFSDLPKEISPSNDAILLVQAGGRVLYINEQAREWFHYQGETPNLERLARSTRPGDILLELCSSEGQARFSIHGRLVEGTSYEIPGPFSSDANQRKAARNQKVMLVALRRPQPTAMAAGESGISEQAMEIFSELSRAMASSLDLEKTLQTILESVERLIPADSKEITVWDPQKQNLIPYHFIGTEGVDRHIEMDSERYSAEQGFSGYLVTQRQSLIIPDVDTFQEIAPVKERKHYPYSSYLGIPLQIAGELVGTLELASLSTEAFGPTDLETLRVLSGQAAVAVKNALLFQDEQKRVLELSGLANLARVVGTLEEPQDIYGRLIDGITALLQVKILGFLIYNESQHLLVAQKPFLGIPVPMLDFYNVNLQPDTAAEEIWLSGEVIHASNAPEDTRLETLGFKHMAVAAGMQDTILMPLSSAGRVLGYLLLADKKNGQPFVQDDLRILTIISSQVAYIIENATLVKESLERAQRSEALRRVASLAASVATLDEILGYSLKELARLLRVDIGLIFLLDENIGELRLHKESLYNVSEDLASQLQNVSMVDPLFRSTVTSSQNPLMTGDMSISGEINPFYAALEKTLQFISVIVVPLVVQNQGVGEIILASRTINFFTQSDLTLVSTTASQLSNALEKATLVEQTDEGLQRRVTQLLSLMRLSRELSTTSDLDHLLHSIFAEALRTTRADCGSITLLDYDREPGTPARVMLHIGDASNGELSALEERVIKGEPYIVENYGLANDLSQVESRPPHSGILSSLVVPIVYQGRTAGTVHLHAREAGRFDDPSLEVAQSLAVQAALAIGNAQRYQEQKQHTELLNRRLETMTTLLETSHSLQAGQTFEQSLEAIAFGIQDATSFRVVWISIYDQQASGFVIKAGAGVPLEKMEELSRIPQPWDDVQKKLQPEFRFSKTYLVPGDGKAFSPREIQFVSTDGVDPGESPWEPQDSLFIPLLNKSGEPLGLIQVDAPRDGKRPDQPMIETLEMFSDQAALVIEGFHQFHKLSDQTVILNEELARSQKALQSVQGNLPVLLHKDLEHTLSIQSLNQRTRRIRAGLDIIELVNEQTSRLDVLTVLGRELLTRMDMDSVLVAEPSDGGLHLVYAEGVIPPGASPQALLGQRNPLRACIQSGEPIFVSNLDENAEWKGSTLLSVLGAKAFIGVPIIAQRSETSTASSTKKIPDSVVLAVSNTPIASFTAEDEHIFTLLSRQVGDALADLETLKEMNQHLQEVDLLLEFSRQLGILDTAQILQSLLDNALRAIPAANAGMLATWSSQMNCLLPQCATGYVDSQKILQIPYRSGESLPGQVFESGQPMSVYEVDFAQHYNLPSDSLLLYRDATEGRLPVSSLIIPLQTFDARLGVLVMDNFKTPGAFSEADQALATSLARQTALTLENARLYQASEQRSAQLQALTNVAGAITSSLQVNELIDSILDQTRSILPFDTGTLWLRKGNTLIIRAAQGFEDSEERVGLEVAVEDSLLLKEMITTSRPLSVSNVRDDPRFTSLVEAHYLSWMGIPLLSKSLVVGVIALEKLEPSFYTPEHVQAMVTFAGQVSVALENANLYEESVRRAAELDERSQRLALVNRVSTALSRSLDQETIFSVITSEFPQALPCSVVSVVTLDASQNPTVRAQSPLKSARVPVPIPQNPIFDRLQETMGIFATEDYRSEEDLQSLAPYLSETETHSLLVIPMASGSNLVGMVMVHNLEPYRFSPEEIDLARTICNQSAVAIQNARLFAETERLFAETQKRSTEISILYDLGVGLTQVLDESHLLDVTFESVNRLIKAESVRVALVDEEGYMTEHIYENGLRLEPLIAVRQGTSFSEYVIQTNRSLLIADTLNERETSTQGLQADKEYRSWLGVPLVARGTPAGVIFVQSKSPQMFDDDDLRLLKQIANQLSVTLDNAQLITQVQSYAADLEKRVSERTEQLAKEHSRIQTLLSIITELSASLDLDLVLSRTLAIINETVQAEHSVILLIQPDGTSLYLRASLGYTSSVPKGGQPSAISANEGLAGWVISNRQAVLVRDLWQDSRWIQRQERTAPHRSAIAVPLMVGEDILGVMIIFHRQAGRFTDDQLDLVQATAKQIAVAINNAQLYNLIRDQAERLGDMLRTQHIETSRSQGILEAVADGVMVTDARRQITLFNASAENILGLHRFDVVGHSLDHFIGLFGRAGQSWVQTIQTWSDNPLAYQPGDVFAEQIMLENRHVVSVHLSPVRLRSDFLGTVSIFRDITHEVEVDRLKSEFVATVSHELRTPMTSIKGYVDVMLMGASGRLTDQQQHFLEIVKSNTERLSILVNDLLDVSRIEAGKVDLSLQPLKLELIADDILSTISRRMKDEDHPLEIEKDIPSDLPLVNGDPARVRQILDNLVENAYQFTPVNGHILIRMRQVDQMVQVDVKDSGIGITPEEGKRIFERFYRGEDPLVLATSGTGLGLSIVQTFVEMHQGRIWYESAGVPGEGSTFSFTLPIYPSVEEGN